MGANIWQPYKSSQMFEVKNPVFSSKKGIFFLVLGLLMLGTIIGGSIFQSLGNSGDISQCMELVNMEEGQPGPTYLQVVEGIEAVKDDFQKNFEYSTLNTLTFDQKRSNAAAKQIAQACEDLELTCQPFLISGSFISEGQWGMPDESIPDYQWIVGATAASDDIVILRSGNNLIED